MYRFRPAMCRAAEGNEWCFGIEGVVRMDRHHGIVLPLRASTTIVADKDTLPHLSHGYGMRVWDERTYRGRRRVERKRAAAVRDCARWHYRHRLDQLKQGRKRIKSRPRAWGERRLGVIGCSGFAGCARGFWQTTCTGWRRAVWSYN